MVRAVDDVHVVEVQGELDAHTSPVAQQQILSLVGPGSRILLDLTQVSFMSSAGIRMLLATHRSVKAGHATVALAGLSPDLKDTMSATGFLPYFAVYDTQESGLQALQLQR
jgi:anti-sigma B factor antagonist